METIEVCAIQGYDGELDGRNLFGIKLQFQNVKRNILKK